MLFFGNRHKQTQATVEQPRAEERRRTLRRRINGPVLLAIPDGSILCGDMVDISTGGLGVIVARQLECEHGCRVHFSIRLGINKEPIDCIGIVVNCSAVVQGFRVGMRFIITDVRQQQAIERFLSEGQGSSFSEAPMSDFTDSVVHLDPPAVVNFPAAMYPKTVRISDLRKS